MTTKKEASLKELWMLKRVAMSDMIRGRYTHKERNIICQGTRRRIFFINELINEVMIDGIRDPSVDDPEDSAVFRVGEDGTFSLCVDLRTLDPILIDRNAIRKELLVEINRLIFTLKKIRSEYRECRKAQA